ncbi:MAG: hypothetical protein ACP5G1_01200 [Nanopusillaceae archaeon]
MTENWFWVIASIIAFGLALFLYFKFSHSNEQFQLINTQINQCQILFNKIDQVCFSNQGTVVYLDFQANKYLNYIISDNKIISCYVYDQFLNHTSDCNIVIDTPDGKIRYYTSGIYYTAYYGKDYEILKLIINKTNPTTVKISLGPLS